MPAALPLRGGGCLPAAAEGMRCSTAHAIPRPWQMGPYFLEPAAPGRAGQGKKVFFQLITANTQEGSCLRSTAGSLDRLSSRPAGHLLSRSSASDSRRSARREAQQQQSTRRSAISGGEHKQVRPSCRHLGIELQIASAFRTQISRPAALSK